MSESLTEQEMERRERMGYAGTPDYWMREAHAALRAEREQIGVLENALKCEKHSAREWMVWSQEARDKLAVKSNEVAALTRALGDQETDRRLLERCRRALDPAWDLLIRDLDARLGKGGEDA